MTRPFFHVYLSKSTIWRFGLNFTCGFLILCFICSSGIISLATFFSYIFLESLLKKRKEILDCGCLIFLTGAGANLVSWLILPRNAVSVGASGAVFGLFAISVLVKLSFDWRKILEVLILGQFVIERVMEAAQASTSFASSSSALQNVNHIAHLSGALVGATLVWLLSRVPSQPADRDKP